MNPNDTENINSQNDTETTDNQGEVVIEETVEETPVEESESVEDTDALKKQIETLKAQKEHWKAKANKPAETVQQSVNKVAKDNISSVDLIALIKNNITEAEDINEVVEWAKFKKISVSEALKNPNVKASLNEKEEQRKTAQATSTGAVRRGTSKVSDDSLLAKARSGSIPETDEDMIRLVRARKGLK
jgi:hypothetical protein